MLYYVVLCCIMFMFCIMLYYIFRCAVHDVFCCIVLHRVVLCTTGSPCITPKLCITLYHVVSYCNMLYHIVLYFVLYHIVLCCITLYRIVFCFCNVMYFIVIVLHPNCVASMLYYIVIVLYRNRITLYCIVSFRMFNFSFICCRNS